MMRDGEVTATGDEPVQITLSIGSWNTVLLALAETPWKTADPLIRSMRAQLIRALEPRVAPRPVEPSQPDEAAAA